MALPAGMRAAVLVIVAATGGLLEDKRRTPGGTRGPSVASLLDEVQLELKDSQRTAVIMCHAAPPHHPSCEARRPGRSGPMVSVAPTGSYSQHGSGAKGSPVSA